MSSAAVPIRNDAVQDGLGLTSGDGTKRTCRGHRAMSAWGVKLTWWIYEYTLESAANSASEQPAR